MDRTSKILLAAIAFGLWTNIAIHLIEPKVVIAQSTTEEGNSALIYERLGKIQEDVHQIKNEEHGIWDGSCLNRNLCR